MSSLTLLDFLNEILDVIKVTSGEVPLLNKQFNLEQILQEIVLLNQNKACNLGLTLSLNFDADVPCYVIGDPTRVSRIVSELVSNSLKFTERGSVNISVRCAKPDPQNPIIEITVSDTGIGIPIEKQQEIFEYFSRLNPSYQGVYKGAGLGLAIIKQFIEDLHGEVRVVSQANQGATFICQIPFEIAPEHQVAKAQVNEDDILLLGVNNPAEAHHHPARILLVEDDAIAAEIASLMLSQLGCEIEWATSGEAGLEKISAKEYDLIFMDIGLPNLDGYEVTKAIRAQRKVVPIIALTAHVGFEHRQKCIEVGMNAVLSKPLLKERAYDMLNIFLPWHEAFIPGTFNKLQSEEVEQQQKVIDLELAKRLINSQEGVVTKLIKKFIDGLSFEEQNIQEAFSKQDWQALYALAHKLKGGAAYCGAVQLHTVCEQLEHAVQQHQNTIYSHYQKLLAAIQELRQADIF